VRVKRVKGSLETLQCLSANSDRLLDERKALTDWLRFRPNNSPFLFPSRNKSGLPVACSGLPLVPFLL